MRFHKGFGHIGIVEVIRLENLFLVFLFARLSKVAGTELAFWSSKKREGKKDIITQVVLWVVIQATDMPTYSKPNQVLKQVVCSMQGRWEKGYDSLGLGYFYINLKNQLFNTTSRGGVACAHHITACPPPLIFRPSYGPTMALTGKAEKEVFSE